MQFNGESLTVGSLDLDEAVCEEDEELKHKTEYDAEPEGPNIGFGVSEDNTYSWNQQDHKQDVPHTIIHYNIQINTKTVHTIVP